MYVDLQKSDVNFRMVIISFFLFFFEYFILISFGTNTKNISKSERIITKFFLVFLAYISKIAFSRVFFTVQDLMVVIDGNGGLI